MKMPITERLPFALVVSMAVSYLLRTDYLNCNSVVNKFPINRLEQLPARVLKSFLASRSISSAGCLDKSDLIRLIINSRPPMPPGQTVPNEPVTPYEEGISTAHSSNSGSREFVAASSGGEFGDLHSDGFFDRNSFLRNLFSDSSSATRNGDSRSVPPSAGDFAAFFGVTNNNLGEESPTTAPPRHQHQQSQSTSRQSASSASQQYNSQFLLSLSLNDIELMPTKRIKELLVTQHVSLTGVVERTDLVQVLLRTINGERISRNLQPLSTIPPPPSFSSSPSSYADTPPKPRKDIPKGTFKEYH
jgi:hypothetical protein